MLSTALFSSLIGFVSVATLIGLVGWAVSAPGHDGAPGPQFDGVRFRNLEPRTRSPRDVLRGIATWRRGAWELTPAAPPDPPPQQVTEGIRLTFVGHATMLIQTEGMNILTDPVWSVAAGPRGWMGPRRRRPAALTLDALPPIHFVLLSHNHYDHLDVPTLIALHRAHGCRVITTLGNAAYLRRFGLDVVELGWWDRREEGALAITCVPAQHFSGRGMFDRDRTLWAGFVVDGPAGRLFFAGDTGWGTHFAAIRERCGAPDIALLPIGAYRPRPIMQPVHIDPEEAVQAHLALGAGRSVPIHFGTFALGADGPVEALEALARARAAEGVHDEAFAPIAHGGMFHFRRG